MSRGVRILVVSAISLVVLGVMAPRAEAAPATATFVKTSDWGSGFEGRYTVTNATTAPIQGWQVAFDLPAGHTISSFWDATMTRSGQRFTFTNVGWNATIAPGATAGFGFIGAPGGTAAVPSNCTLNGSPCGGGSVGVPGVPGTPTVTGATGSSISLSWAASSGTATGYRVFEGTALQATVSGTTATISGLATCSTHTYTVRAFNAQGESGASGPVTATTTGCPTGEPGKPGTPAVTGTTGSSISLSWAASSGTVTGYRVFEGTTLRATVSTASATISGLATCTSHTYTVRGFNGQGESVASDPVTASTSGCPTGPLPRHILTGYWHNFVNAAVELRLSAVPNDYDVVAVAFGESTATPGQVTFGLDPGLGTALGGYTDAQFRADVQTLHGRGKKVILSVGGELGRVQVNSATSATAFSDSVFGLMQSYGFDGVDIDLENGLNPTFMAQALRQLRTRVGASLIITMAPQTIDMQSTGGSYFQLALNIQDILTVVHTQFYNSGSMLGCDQMAAYAQGSVNFITALACIQLENGLRPDQVAVGLPAGPGAAGGGVVSPSVVTAALDCLARGTNCGSFRPPRTYPAIRGAMTWSINWDAANNFNFSRTVKPHLGTLP